MDQYTADDIVVLEDWEHVRKRAGMYFGGTDVRGVNHIVDELIANALDQFLAGQATQIGVRLDGQVIEVWDDGAGFPFEKTTETGERFVETHVTKFHWTATADNHAPHIHLAFSGVGLAPVCAVSDELTIESWRHGQLWRQHFRRGRAITSPEPIESGNGRGTSVRVFVDNTIMQTRLPDWDAVVKRTRESACLFTGVQICCGDQVFYSPDGMLDLALREGSKRMLNDQPRFNTQGLLKDVQIQVAAIGHAERKPSIFSWVNGQTTADGGSHVHGLKQALKATGWNPAIACIHVITHDPQFAGPIKSKLDVPHVRSIVSRFLKPRMREYYSRH